MTERKPCKCWSCMTEDCKNSDDCGAKSCELCTVRVTKKCPNETPEYTGE